MSINKNPLTVTYAALVPSPRGFISDTLKFIVDEEPIIPNDLVKTKGKATLLTGITDMTEAVDYPLLVYNSYLPNNSELIVTNIAERDKTSQVIELGNNLSFICFVNGAFLADYWKDKIKSNHSMIYFLAWDI